ncbi:acidobacterial duplicated orphan permease [Luteitalea pratensis]|uniref:Acidobacterial duplicated orphan permease n=1 Tax=Luteitalea pratensis TaxID=1855912 RepID=A0A143PXI1_LUTPR|nr:hypothetical protein [Luteitalea pratensis]AMY12499.1 acidobacterial duplicated orphan permease [Luteitalea pratensis]
MSDTTELLLGTLNLLILKAVSLGPLHGYGVLLRIQQISRGETLLLVTIGAVLGTLSSLAANRYIAAQLFGVTPRDPAAVGVALSVLGLVTMLAGYLPARQASRIDPVRALRTE